MTIELIACAGPLRPRREDLINDARRRRPPAVPPRRVLVAGVSGVGKTTLARQLAPLLDSRHVELDGLFHGPGWTPRATFLDDVRALVATETWVTDWNYGPARPLLVGAADLLVWLDLPYPVTFARVVRRTVRRRVRREVLWNGNREGPLRHLLIDPSHVVRWSVSTRHAYAARVPQALADHPDRVVVRPRSRREVQRWLARRPDGSQSGRAAPDPS